MIVNVVGTTWGGFKSAYTYEWKQEELPTPEQVMQLAGDFSLVDDFECVKVITKFEEIPNGTRFIKDTVVVKPWTGEDSENQFLDRTEYA